jgi:hypothetical protein
MPAQRRAALAITVVASACVALAGCGSGSGGSAPSSPSAAAPSAPAAAAGSVGKLTGNFCTDLKNIGTSIKLPADAQDSVGAAKQKGVRYLDQVGKYFSGLSAEAPPQVASSLSTLASEFQTLAGAVSSGAYDSVSKIDQQLQSLITSGGAFSKLISYVATKCG